MCATVVQEFSITRRTVETCRGFVVDRVTRELYLRKSVKPALWGRKCRRARTGADLVGGCSSKGRPSRGPSRAETDLGFIDTGLSVYRFCLCKKSGMSQSKIVHSSIKKLNYLGEKLNPYFLLLCLTKLETPIWRTWAPASERFHHEGEES